jgi:hypothetical protein
MPSDRIPGPATCESYATLSNARCSSAAHSRSQRQTCRPESAAPHRGPEAQFMVRLGSSRYEVERELIVRTLAYAGGNKVRASVDHLHPRVHGGRGRANKVPACKYCNSHKSWRSVEQFREWVRARLSRGSRRQSESSSIKYVLRIPGLVSKNVLC